MTWDLRQGWYQDVLADVECDALICDPPYGARTHVGHDHSARPSRRYDSSDRSQLSYDAWGDRDVQSFVEFWHQRTSGWLAIMSCSQLVPAYESAFESVGRCSFAPIACVVRGMTVRMAGDGPSNWVVYLNVSRPRSKEWARWGTLPGAYVVGRGNAKYIGGKPELLMNAIVRDYTRPGDLVCDPCAGMATTGVACLQQGRSFIGAEVKADTFEAARGRLSNPQQQELFA